MVLLSIRSLLILLIIIAAPVASLVAPGAFTFVDHISAADSKFAHHHHQKHGCVRPIRSSFVDSSSTTTCLAMSASTTNIKTGPEIEVIHHPDQSFLEKKGVFNWGTWGCGVSKFPWTYGDNESCYLLAGKVTVTPSDGRKVVTFGKGDFVTFPAGMSCTWDVSEAVKKHYMFF